MCPLKVGEKQTNPLRLPQPAYWHTSKYCVAPVRSVRTSFVLSCIEPKLILPVRYTLLINEDVECDVSVPTTEQHNIGVFCGRPISIDGLL